MTKRKYIQVVQKACMVDRRSMVDDLVQCIFFFGYAGVIDIDQSVGAAGKEEVCLSWMVLNLQVDVIGDT